MNPGRSRHQLAVMLAVPLVVSAILSAGLITLSLANHMDRVSDTSARIIADQLAQLGAVFVVGEDVLAMNVLLDEQINAHPISFAAIYDAEGRLLAQSGSRTGGESVSSDITWQNESLGHLLIQVDPTLGESPVTGILLLTLALHGALIAAVVFLTVYARDLLVLSTGQGSEREDELPEEEPEPTPEPQLFDECTVLFVRYRPERLVDAGLIADACRLYRGEAEPASRGELTLTFRHTDQLNAALGCAAVIRELLRTNERIHFNLAIDAGTGDGIKGMLKKTRYLATLAEGDCLLSNDAFLRVNPTDRQVFGLADYTSGMVTEGEIFQCTAIAALHSTQADKLIERRRKA